MSSKLNWSQHAARIRKESGKAPAGCKKIAEIAAEIGVSEKAAGEIVKTLVKEGRAERVQGKALTLGGLLVPAVYYRLLK